MLIVKDEEKDKAQEPVCAKKYCHPDHCADPLAQIGFIEHLQDYGGR